MPLAPADRVKLAKFLGLLGSAHLGERAAAAAAADRLVRGRGLTWQDVLEHGAGRPQPSKTAPNPSVGWRADLALCRERLAHLTDWEANFVLSLSAKRNSLSPGQQAKLTQIADLLRSEGRAAG